MAPNNHRRSKKKSSNNQGRNLFLLLQRMQRLYSCWNCHQFGHTRHQCQLPRTISCSFCRKPGILTVDCRCQNKHQPHRFNRPYQRTEYLSTSVSYNSNVRVPDGNQPNSYVPRENLVVVVPNDERNEEEMETNEVEEEEYLEIHPESDSLDEM